MPDITMCNSDTCPLAKTCYRNERSGTKPSEYRQAYYLGLSKEGDQCKQYWPIKGETNE